jgi:hypothetical protein
MIYYFDLFSFPRKVSTSKEEETQAHISRRGKEMFVHE